MGCDRETIDRLHAQISTLEIEREEARATNMALNKRCQSAEAGLAAVLRGEGTKPGPSGFGRALANSAATLYMYENDALRILATQLVGALCGVKLSERCWCPKDTDWTQSCDDANAAIAAAEKLGVITS